MIIAKGLKNSRADPRIHTKKCAVFQWIEKQHVQQKKDETMKTRLLTLLTPLFLLLLAFIPQTALAKETAPHRPMTGICSGGCQGNADWSSPGGSNITDGGLTTVYVPSYTGSSTNVLQRFIAFEDSVDNEYFDIGYCFSNVGGTCKSNSGNYFTNYIYGGNSHITTYSMPAGDKGHSVQFGIQGRTNAFGDITGWDVIINDENSGTVTCPFPSQSPPYALCVVSTNNFIEWFDVTLQNYVKTNITGTLQGAFSWIFNQYEYQDSNSFDLIMADESTSPTLNGVDGAQFYVITAPNGETNEGGSIGSCNEDNGSTTNC